MAAEPIVARTAWMSGGTTYVTIRWNGAVRTRVANADGRGGWTITLPGVGDTAVILPATIDTEPTEGRLARGATMGARLATTDNEPRPARRTSVWHDLPPTSATPQSPRDRTVFSQALKTIRARADGATLDEIKESFREIDLYHHDPLTLLRWQHDNRGWGFKMNAATRRITIWNGDPAAEQREAVDANIVTFAPPPASSSAQHKEQQAPLVEDVEPRRSEAQAEWRRIEEERQRLERDRREFEEQRRLLATASNSVTLPAATIPAEKDLPSWLRDLPAPDRFVFQHLAEHGSINETEATRLLGGARQFRRFSGQLEEHLSRVPFRVRIDASGGIKCYVREERGSE